MPLNLYIMPQIHKKPDIIVSCGSYSWGGLEMISLETAIKLRNAGNSVKILCSENSRLYKEAEIQNFETLPFFSKDKNGISSINKLRKYLKKFNPDVIHSNHSHDLWILTPALKAARSKTKLFLTKHMASGIKKTDPLHRFLYNRVNGIIAISNYIRTNVLETCPVKNDKIYYVPVGVDLEKFNITRFNIQSVKNELDLPPGKTIIGIVARITPGKGYEEFIEAAKIINSNYDDNVFFLMGGNASEDESVYETFIVNKAKTDIPQGNYKFTGFTPDAPKLLAAIDILAFPSHNESFGRVLLEAMAMEIPSAASGNAGVLDIAVDNETSILVEPKNSVMLAEALMKLIVDKSLREQMGSAAKKRAEEHFAFKIMTDKLSELYNK